MSILPDTRWRPALRGPAIVMGFIGVIAAMIAGVTIAEGWHDRALDRHGVAVEGTVVEVHNSDLAVTVRFAVPDAAEPVTTKVDMYDEEWDLAPGQAVGLLVDADHPRRAKLAGDHYPLIPLVTLTALVPLAFPAALLLLRLRHARRAERLAGAHVPTFRVHGRLVPRERRWRESVTDLHLYPLDDPVASGPPLAVVPLIERYPESWDSSKLRTVDVKGQVRDLGLIVANADGHVLWPAGPARRSTRRRPAAAGAPAPTTAPAV